MGGLLGGGGGGAGGGGGGAKGMLLTPQIIWGGGAAPPPTPLFLRLCIMVYVQRKFIYIDFRKIFADIMVSIVI